MVEKQSKRILPQLFSCIQKQKDITVIALHYYKKIPVNCFLHSKITLLEHGYL